MAEVQEFNKDEFARIAKELKGTRSLRAMSDVTKVSLAHLSRMMTGSLATPPTPETIKKMVEGSAYPNEMYCRLMAAAGYIPEPLAEDGCSRRLSQKEMRMMQRSFFSTIVNDLYINFNDTINLSFKKTIGTNQAEAQSGTKSKDEEIIDMLQPDMVVDISNAPINKWYFEFFTFKNVYDEGAALRLARQAIASFCGKLAFLSIDKTAKYSIVVDSIQVFDKMRFFFPKSLFANISVVLIDSDAQKVIVEFYLSTLSTNEDVSNYLIKTLRFKSDKETLKIVVEDYEEDLEQILQKTHELENEMVSAGIEKPSLC